VAVKRVYVVGDPQPWADGLAAAARALRVGDPTSAGIDLGPMITAGARARFHQMIQNAGAAGGTILAGGEPLDGKGWFYPPTVILAHSTEPEDALAGCFGPVMVVRGVRDVPSAIAAANRSPFALAASVWGRNLSHARKIASLVQAGMVTINDAVTPTGHASAPFGGAKASGFGRTKGPFGLCEFAQPQALLLRRSGGFRPHLFPYSASASFLAPFLSFYRRVFHPTP
jgi:acyl-CoA reductase-like NAD-dependent aldehyde dehydrogenase